MEDVIRQYIGVIRACSLGWFFFTTSQSNKNNASVLRKYTHIQEYIVFTNSYFDAVTLYVMDFKTAISWAIAIVHF